MKFKRSVGAFMFLIGTFMLISSQSGITGNVVSEIVDSMSSVFGLILIIGGLVLMVGGKGKGLVDILNDAVVTDHGTYRMKDTRDALRYTDLKSKSTEESYSESLEPSLKLSKYDVFLDKNDYLDNEASKHLFRNNIPDKLREMVKIARKCGYDVFENEGDGNRVKDKDGNIITELGNRSRIEDRNIQKARLKSMSNGESNFRPNNNS